MLNWGGVISLIFYWSILFDLFIWEKENFLNCEILWFFFDLMLSFILVLVGYLVLKFMYVLYIFGFI